jgi:hypothetical protein
MKYNKPEDETYRDDSDWDGIHPAATGNPV